MRAHLNPREHIDNPKHYASVGIKTKHVKNGSNCPFIMRHQPARIDVQHEHELFLMKTEKLFYKESGSEAFCYP